MIHSLIKRKISAYFDDELSQGKQKRLFLHLNKCSECTKYFERQKQITSDIKNTLGKMVAAGTAPDHLWENINAKIQKMEKPETKYSFIPKYAFFIILTGIVLVASIVYRRNLTILCREFAVPAFFDFMSFLIDSVKNFYSALFTGVIGIYKSVLHFIFVNHKFILNKLWIIVFSYIMFSVFGALLIAGSFRFNYDKLAKVIRR